ncbi:PREDICTED: uncharacterized protein LOC105461327 [Wasmannia auropunctata]|uniref:uncharacterized protein LOC105461327 n=1 Tax=Wasmannia auropunctata TaxID=64793 RepID=UPI0005EF1352|nr:PREDICTED: uncharacterized protein LOC105461327 [Wasmannia auropunctata]
MYLSHRSETCPQCRARTTKDRIYKAYFTFSNNNLQGRINCLKFQDLLNERSIMRYTFENTVLKKQNAELKQKVRVVENDIRWKNSVIHTLKVQIRNFKKRHQEYEVMKKELSGKNGEVKQIRAIYKALSACRTFTDVHDMFITADHDTMIHCFFLMKEAMYERKWKQSP